jgi:hypothetical protein
MPLPTRRITPESAYAHDATSHLYARDPAVAGVPRGHGGRSRGRDVSGLPAHDHGLCGRVPIPIVPQPEYGHGIIEPTFGTVLTRITGDAGDPIGALNTSWGTIARHTYSKVQPWNANQTLISIDNHGTGTRRSCSMARATSRCWAPCANYDHWDSRWHPKLVHSREQINVTEAGTELMWFDVVNCVKTRTGRSRSCPTTASARGRGTSPTRDGSWPSRTSSRWWWWTWIRRRTWRRPTRTGASVRCTRSPRAAGTLPSPTSDTSAMLLDIALREYIDVKYGRVGGEDTTECVSALRPTPDLRSGHVARDPAHNHGGRLAALRSVRGRDRTAGSSRSSTPT